MFSRRRWCTCIIISTFERGSSIFQGACGGQLCCNLANLFATHWICPLCPFPTCLTLSPFKFLEPSFQFCAFFPLYPGGPPQWAWPAQNALWPLVVMQLLPCLLQVVQSSVVPHCQVLLCRYFSLSPYFWGSVVLSSFNWCENQSAEMLFNLSRVSQLLIDREFTLRSSSLLRLLPLFLNVLLFPS